MLNNVAHALWDFFVAWGEYRYKIAKKNNFRYIF
jgi:hypothetical protein